MDFSRISTWVYSVPAVDSRPALPVVIPGSGMCKADFTGDFAPRDVFLPVVKPKMRCIMAIFDQKDSFLAVACARPVSLVFSLRTLCSLLLFTGPDALHHGRYGQSAWMVSSWSFTRPLCATTYAYGSDCRKLCRPAVAVLLNVVVDFFCRGAEAVPDYSEHHRDSPVAVH